MAEDGLRRGLRTEFAAVYAYSVAGAQLSGDRLSVARANQVLHRDRRDAVMRRLAAVGAEPLQEEAAYTLPGEVADADSAAALLTEVEKRTTAQWRSVLADTDGADRRTAVDAFASSAVTMARWKRAMGESPATTAFPGRR